MCFKRKPSNKLFNIPKSSASKYCTQSKLQIKIEVINKHVLTNK